MHTHGYITLTDLMPAWQSLSNKTATWVNGAIVRSTNSSCTPWIFLISFLSRERVLLKKFTSGGVGRWGYFWTAVMDWLMLPSHCCYCCAVCSTMIECGLTRALLLLPSATITITNWCSLVLQGKPLLILCVLSFLLLNASFIVDDVAFILMAEPVAQ